MRVDPRSGNEEMLGSPRAPVTVAYLTLAVLGTGVVRGAASQSVPTPLNTSSRSPITRRVDDLEQIMDTFFRRDPAADAKAAVNRLIEEHNAWVEGVHKRHEAERKRLQADYQAIKRLEAEIKAMDTQLDRKKPKANAKGASIRAYNGLVERRNGLVRTHAARTAAYKEEQTRFNGAATRANEQIDRRKTRMQESKTQALATLSRYKEWLESDQPEQVAKAVNHCYADVHRRLRSAPHSGTLRRLLQRLRGLRHELGERAIRQANSAENGLILLRATLCGREECVMVVDTGASFVTISPALVEALGLSDRLGEPVTVSLAAGVKRSGPELRIPRLRVLGMEARDVKAVVLDEAEVGIDGLLGLSFLHHFDYRIDSRRDPKLMLRPKRKQR